MGTGVDIGRAQALSHEREDRGDLFARHVELLDDQGPGLERDPRRSAPLPLVDSGWSFWH